MKPKTSLTQSQKSKILMPEHRILGGLAVALILGPIMAVIIIMLYGAFYG